MCTTNTKNHTYVKNNCVQIKFWSLLKAIILYRPVASSQQLEKLPKITICNQPVWLWLFVI